MKLGLFMMPSHPPERNIYDSHQRDLDYLALVDELGYDEAWIGEHFTAPWEPIPAPDLMIAQALMRTSRIRLGVGSHLLPFHHPAELAHRVAYLGHLAQGRFMFGIGGQRTPHRLGPFRRRRVRGTAPGDDYPKTPGHLPCSSLTHPLPLSSRRDSG